MRDGFTSNGDERHVCTSHLLAQVSKGGLRACGSYGSGSGGSSTACSEHTASLLRSSDAQEFGRGFRPSSAAWILWDYPTAPWTTKILRSHVCAKLEEIFDPPWCAVARLGEFGDAAGLLRTTLMINDLVNSAQDVSASVCCALRTQDVARS